MTDRCPNCDHPTDTYSESGKERRTWLACPKCGFDERFHKPEPKRMVPADTPKVYAA